MREEDEYLTTFHKQITKMTNKTKEIKGHGFPNQSGTTNSMQFMGREAYLKDLEDTIRSKVVKFPRDTTP